MSSESAASNIILDDNSLKIAFVFSLAGRTYFRSFAAQLFIAEESGMNARTLSVVERLRTPLATLWPDRSITVC
jgi:hypothetical protein